MTEEITLFEHKDIDIDLIELNTGQIEGLKTNPRTWTRKELNRLKKSIIETPELMHERRMIVYAQNGKFIVIDGNMRLSAVRELKFKDVPCSVIPEGTAVRKMAEYLFKCNGAFGAWDFDALANGWYDYPLVDWGVPAWEQKNAENAAGEGDGSGAGKPVKMEIEFMSEYDRDIAFRELVAAGYNCKIRK